MAEKDDIFKEAAEEAFAKIRAKQEELDAEQETPAETEVSTVTEEEQRELALMHTEEGDKWNNLAKYINGAGADRLMKELQSMSGRDFVRNYLKVLEHFKPKLVRSDSSPDDDQDRTLQIEMVQRMPDGEIRSININSTRDGD